MDDYLRELMYEIDKAIENARKRLDHIKLLYGWKIDEQVNNKQSTRSYVYKKDSNNDSNN